MMEIQNTYKDLVSCALIGKGSFGKVYKAVDPESKREYALKVQSLAKAKVNLLERDVHVRGDPTFVVRAYFVAKDSLNIYILQDYFTGDLTLFPSGDMFKASYISHQMGRCITYLHSLEVIHRDIKPTNFLMAHDYRVKLTDFGICAKLGDDVPSICGTPNYIAPEAIHCQPCSVMSDWFAFGLVIFYLVTGQHFSSSRTFLEAHNFVSNRENINKRLNFVHDACMQSYIRPFLQYRQSDRMTYTDSLQKLSGLMKETVEMTHDEFLSRSVPPMLMPRKPTYIPNEKMLDKPFYFDGFTRIDGVHAAKFRERGKGRFVKETTIPLYHPSPKRSEDTVNRDKYNLRGTDNA